LEANAPVACGPVRCDDQSGSGTKVNVSASCGNDSSSSARVEEHANAFVKLDRDDSALLDSVLEDCSAEPSTSSRRRLNKKSTAVVRPPRAVCSAPVNHSTELANFGECFISGKRVPLAYASPEARKDLEARMESARDKGSLLPQPSQPSVTAARARPAGKSAFSSHLNDVIHDVGNVSKKRKLNVPSNVASLVSVGRHAETVILGGWGEETISRLSGIRADGEEVGCSSSKGVRFVSGGIFGGVAAASLAPSP
jgi:hypothetical protein